MNSFFQRVHFAFKRNNSVLCVGLDPDVSKMPTNIAKSKEPLYDFLAPIIDATHDKVCCYKPNIAFYEAYGPRGIEQLIKVMEHIRGLEMDIPIILDAKRGDIGNTAKAYAHTLFDYFRADAVTVSPYMGGDTLQPFLDYVARGIIILCLTSNPGYGDFETLESGGEPLFIHVAKKAAEWNSRENIALVVGATHPEEAARVRAAAPEIPFLMPGIGAQGGDPAEIMKIGFTKSGFPPIVNSSRGILYASAEEDFAEKAGKAAIEVRDKLNRYIET